MSRSALLTALLPLVALLVVLWLSSVSVPGDLHGCPADCASSVERAPGPLRVLDLNVFHDFPGYAHLEERLDLAADEITRRDADVALLEEVPWTIGLGSAADRLAAATGLNHLSARANGNRWAIGFEEGSLILSRFPLRDAAWAELEPRAGPFEHRIALAATADTSWGPIRFVVTHLAGTDAVNAGQAASLVAWVAPQPRPLLVAGDFNAVPGTATYDELPWTDLFASLHPDETGATCCDDDLTAPPPPSLPRRVDYLFGDGLATVSIEVILAQPVAVADGWLRVSDHAGLLAELTVGP